MRSDEPNTISGVFQGMKTLVALFLLLLTSTLSAQTIYPEDGVRKLLITKNDLRLGNPVDFTIFDFPEFELGQHTQDPFMPYGEEPFWHFETFQVILPKDLCGERYHDNKILASRCECVDSVLHGKSVYWDNQGRIDCVLYYRYGKIYLKKNYKNGTLSEVVHYTYKDGEQLKHGQHIEYTANGKTTSNYRYGLKHGTETMIENDVKRRESRYVNDHLVEDRWWNAQGILYREEFFAEEGGPNGKWFNMDPTGEFKTYARYENGSLRESTCFKNGVLYETKIERPDGTSNTERFYPQGNKMSAYSKDSSGIQQFDTWNKNGEPINHYQLKDHQFVGNGFYEVQKETIHYSAKTDSENHPYLEIYRVLSGDTIAFLLSLNTGDIIPSPLITNRFTQVNGRAVPQDEWNFYENNKILRSVQYEKGLKNGQAIYFDTTKAEPSAFLYANYLNGEKHGNWLYRKDSILVTCRFHEGRRHGTFTKFDRIGDTTYVDPRSPKQYGYPRILSEKRKPNYLCSYTNDTLHGEFIQFYDSEKPHWKGNYLANKKSGIWTEYDVSGNVRLQGSFREGVPMKDWKFYELNANGKWKKRRISAPEFIVDDALLVTPDPLLDDSNL